LTQTVYPPTGEAILTQYQVQQILAGYASTLRQGKLLIRESLNRGWKGGVFLAHDTESQRQETLRMLPMEQLHGLASDTDAASAIKQVGACIKRLQNPNLAKIYRFESQGDWLLISSEYLQGDTLRKVIARSHPKKTRLNACEMLTTAIELACGVQYLHEQGCLHLDLSPDRWIKRETGTWCLLDAGWANLLLSKQWKVMPQSAGLPPVLPPELMEDLEIVSPLTDIYALGQVFRFLMTGDFPLRSLKMSELERPNLPSVVLPSPSSHSESIARSRDSRRFMRNKNSWSASEPRDWKVEWNQLLDSMTNTDMSARPQSVDEIIRNLTEIVGLTRAKYPSETAIEEDSIRSGKSQLSIGQRLRRLFGQNP
jgi:serine/threonine protein kinase